MRKKSWIVLFAVTLLTAAAGVIAFTGVSIGQKTYIKPVAEMLSLGLDLRGGIYTVYYADQAEYGAGEFDALMDGTIEVLMNRLTEKGYTEATVARQGADGIIVTIPDISDPQAVIDIIGTPARLQFVGPNGETVIEGKDIEKAGYAYDQESDNYVVGFELTPEGTRAFADATKRFLGQIIYVVLDGEVISNPKVGTVITGGSGQITLGHMTREQSYEEARNLAMLIMSGSLPLDIEEGETRAVSATLGEDAISGALAAGAIGVTLVYLFMLALYRLPGLMADIALTIYIIIVLFAIALFRIQLTLPGIAGILLGIGMAVDANVVIFERFREEIISGRSYESAMIHGHKNALRAIVDSNITTLIAAFVLMYFGTTTVKGFSYTLCLGVLVSMFTSVFVTRFLLARALGLGFVRRFLYVR